MGLPMKLLLVNFLVLCDDFVAKSIDDYILDDDQWNKNHGQCFFNDFFTSVILSIIVFPITQKFK